MYRTLLPFLALFLLRAHATSSAAVYQAWHETALDLLKSKKLPAELTSILEKIKTLNLNQISSLRHSIRPLREEIKKLEETYKKDSDLQPLIGEYFLFLLYLPDIVEAQENISQVDPVELEKALIRIKPLQHIIPTLPDMFAQVQKEFQKQHQLTPANIALIEKSQLPADVADIFKKIAALNLNQEIDTLEYQAIPPLKNALNYVIVTYRAYPDLIKKLNTYYEGLVWLSNVVRASRDISQVEQANTAFALKKVAPLQQDIASWQNMFTQALKNYANSGEPPLNLTA